MQFDKSSLLPEESEEISRLLAFSKQAPPKLEDMWGILDLVWDELGCDNKKLDWEKISKYYSHPVWLLNGLFIEQHEISMQHRHKIAEWISKNNLAEILDYGGGFGTLARLIAENNSAIRIDIYEPHPHNIAIKKSEAYPNLSYIENINRKYDCLVCTDVLEHIADPLMLFAEMINSVKIGGFLVIANCFYPVIKCHLPQTFHLRQTFNWFAAIMGLESIGWCEGSHAYIYKKKEEKTFNWIKIRIFEFVSKALFPLLESSWGHRFVRLVNNPVDTMDSVKRKVVKIFIK